MTPRIPHLAAATLAIAAAALLAWSLNAPAGVGRAIAAEDADSPSAAAPASIEEARARARLLHETIHGSLQVMHRDFFREESSTIPSHSLEDVFKELARGYKVQVHWLAVNAQAMNIDNKPRNEFEREAVKALAAGREQYEDAAEDSYRYAGSIRLASQCLKCHLPSRRSNDDRAAGLVIIMPLKK